MKCFRLLNFTVKCYTQDLAVHSDLTDQLTTGTRADSVGDCQRRDPHRGAEKAATTSRGPALPPRLARSSRPPRHQGRSQSASAHTTPGRCRMERVGSGCLMPRAVRNPTVTSRYSRYMTVTCRQCEM